MWSGEIQFAGLDTFRRCSDEFLAIMRSRARADPGVTLGFVAVSQEIVLRREHTEFDISDNK